MAAIEEEGDEPQRAKYKSSKSTYEVFQGIDALCLLLSRYTLDGWGDEPSG
jgi:hypothetical protein